MLATLPRLLAAFPPVLLFLAALIYLDSYKLVRVRWMLAALAGGGAAAGLGYAVNLGLLRQAGMETVFLARYAAPVVEEMLKAAVVVALVRAGRVGFLVDAAIFGFAVGTGFALIENAYYLFSLADARLGVWLLRGCGTAIMHGGTAAIVAMVGKTLSERRSSTSTVNFLPGLAAAAVLHSLFNHFFLSPLASAVGLLLILPSLIVLVFRRGEQSLREWLNVGFDGDTELLELIHSGEVSSSPVGRYLQALRERFPGEVLADMLCFLRLHLELSLRAKGLLLMRESGFRMDPDPETLEKLQELEYLERSIGRTGKLAMEPFLPIRGKDLWQLTMLRG